MNKAFSIFILGLTVAASYQLALHEQVDMFLITVSLAIFLVEIFVLQQVHPVNITLKDMVLEVILPNGSQRKIAVIDIEKAVEQGQLGLGRLKAPVWTILLADGEQLELTESKFYPRVVLIDLDLQVKLSKLIQVKTDTQTSYRTQ